MFVGNIDRTAAVRRPTEIRLPHFPWRLLTGNRPQAPLADGCPQVQACAQARSDREREASHMGYQTDFVGYLHVQPALNDDEIRLLNSVAHHLPLTEGGGLQTVDRETARLHTVLARSPCGWSNWEACQEGCCLSYDGGDKANHMIPWLKYLMATLLVPGASVNGTENFEAFTCDHVFNGMVVGSRRDNRELYAITAVENEVEVELLWPGVPEWSSYPPLPYQREIDRVREWIADYRRDEARKRVLARRAQDEPDPW